MQSRLAISVLVSGALAAPLIAGGLADVPPVASGTELAPPAQAPAAPAATLASPFAGAAKPASAASAALAPSPAVEALLAQLDSPSYAERQAASDKLFDDGSLTLAMIQTILARPNLSVETRLRLAPIARRRFDDSPRGALGVEFDTFQAGTVVRRALANFPAAKFLKPGDEIIAVGGLPVSDFSGRARQNFNNLGSTLVIRPHIVCREPGELLSMTIRRHGPAILARAGMQQGRWQVVIGPDGRAQAQPNPQLNPQPNALDPDAPQADAATPKVEELEIQVPLGKFSDLANTQPLSPTDLEEAWRIRSKSLGLKSDGQVIADPFAAPVALGPTGPAIVFDEGELDRQARLAQRLLIGQVSPTATGGAALVGTEEDRAYSGGAEWMAQTFGRNAQGQLGGRGLGQRNAQAGRNADANQWNGGIQIVQGPDGIKIVNQGANGLPNGLPGGNILLNPVGIDPVAPATPAAPGGKTSPGLDVLLSKLTQLQISAAERRKEIEGNDLQLAAIPPEDVTGRDQLTRARARSADQLKVLLDRIDELKQQVRAAK